MTGNTRGCLVVRSSSCSSSSRNRLVVDWGQVTYFVHCHRLGTGQMVKSVPSSIGDRSHISSIGRVRWGQVRLVRCVRWGQVRLVHWGQVRWLQLTRPQRKRTKGLPKIYLGVKTIHRHIGTSASGTGQMIRTRPQLAFRNLEAVRLA
jgi:hypothetical protein